MFRNVIYITAVLSYSDINQGLIDAITKFTVKYLTLPEDMHIDQKFAETLRQKYEELIESDLKERIIDVVAACCLQRYRDKLEIHEALNAETSTPANRKALVNTADEVFFMQLHALQAKYEKPVKSKSHSAGAEEALKDFEDNIFKPGKIIVHANPNHPYFKERNKYIEGNLITHSNELAAFHNNDQLDKAFKDSTQKVARLSQGRFLSFHRMDTPVPAWIYIVQAKSGLTYYQATWNKTEVVYQRKLL